MTSYKFNPLTTDWGGRLAGPFLFLLAFILYSFTLCLTPYPGESARFICTYADIDPFPPMSHLLWYHLVQFVSWFAGSALVLILNFLSALFGAGAIWILYEVASRIPHDRTSEELETSILTGAAKTLTGIVAALFLMTCAPFWFVSTRAHTASFDVFLVLLSIYLLILFYETRRAGFAYGFALIFGVGITEFATLIVLAPFFGVALIYCLFRANLLKFKPLLLIGLGLAVGLSLYWIYAWEYTLSPAYTWREFTSYFLVLFHLWRDQYRTIRFSLSQVGWLLVFLVTILPWLIVMFPKRSSTRSSMKGSILLHILLTLLNLLVMFNAMIAPWQLLKLQPLLITPYVILATCIGYLAGYWYIIILGHRVEILASAFAKRVVSGGYVCVLAILFLAVGALNFQFVDRRATSIVDRFVDEVVKSMGDRRWLISNGYFDDLIQLRSRQQEKPLILINTAQGKSESYLKYLASLFEDPRLKGLVRIGLEPFLNEWLNATPGIEKEVAVLVSPDIWFASGYIPVPNGVLFLGVTNKAEVNGDHLYARQERFWDQYKVILRKETEESSLVSGWNRWVRSHVSKLVNNTGVLLEDLGKSKDAFEAYTVARMIDTNNLSALLNQLMLANAESLLEKTRLEVELAEYERRTHKQPDIWSLSYHYGYVRNPEAFANRGWLWAMSGKPKVAISEMQRALATGASKQKTELAMAFFYSMQQKHDESEQMYLSVLKEDAKNPVALLGLARIALRNMDFDSARNYLARLRETGAPETTVGAEEAILEGLVGNMSAAKAKLLKLSKESPNNLRVWSLLSILAMVDQDEILLEKCTAMLTPQAANFPDILNTLTTLALNRGDSKTARKYLENILRINPKNVPALERILQLDMLESNRPLAEKHVEQILSIDPKNAIGNLILGSIQYARAEYEQAEASYRTSLASKRSDRALNELAWILQMKGHYEESLKLVQEAIALNKNGPSAWDTLGVVLMHLNRLDEAQEALQQALSLRPGNPTFLLHIAQLYERKGMNKEALKLAYPLLARPTEMPPEDFEELRALIKKLRGTQT